MDNQGESQQIIKVDLLIEGDYCLKLIAGRAVPFPIRKVGKYTQFAQEVNLFYNLILSVIICFEF